MLFALVGAAMAAWAMGTIAPEIRRAGMIILSVPIMVWGGCGDDMPKSEEFPATGPESHAMFH